MYGFRKCLKETQGTGWIKQFFSCVPSVLDYRLRKRDFWFHRSYGGLSLRFLKLDGHAPLAYLVPSLFLIFLIYGPTLGWRGIPALAILVVSWICLYFVAWTFGEKHLMWGQLLVLSAVALVVWNWAGPKTLEFDRQLYQNIFLPLILFYVLIPLLLAKILSIFLFLKLRDVDTFRNLLPHVKLLPKPPKAPEFSYWSILHSLVHVPLRYPLHLIFFPALGALFIPYNFHVGWWAIGLVGATWLMLTFFSLHNRFDFFLPILWRTFFTGGALIVSLLIIVLGAGRVVEISYIQTVVESSNWKILLRYIAAFYFFFWFTEYWLNRQLTEKLMQLLRKPSDPIGQAGYDLDPNDPISTKTKVDPMGRELQIHAGSRIMAIGRLKANRQEIFQSYERRELFERILEQAALNDLTRKVTRNEDTKALPFEIRRRIRSYFSTVNMYFIVLTIILGICLHNRFQVPQAVVSQEKPGIGVDLAKLIWQNPIRKRVILLAASGGGTRAALYTQSVLHGLQEIGALKDLVLASGVSGGGMALAYFAARQEELEKGGKRAWDRYACDMSYPFIWDVLNGASEWRITAGTRLGNLLSESFGRVFYGNNAAMPTRKKTFGEVNGFGLILNTSLAGHLKSETCLQPENFPEAAAACRKLTDGSIAGGRLIFTNLSDKSSFSSQRIDEDMPYVVIQAQTVFLNIAAALNANFPPVFSNAAVDIDSKQRYWVTDGGVVDNRGMISLLLALEGALKHRPAGAINNPEIWIILMEASAGSTAYKQDRGIGTSFGASAKIANKLICRLRSSVTALYPGSVRFFNLTMPEFLRIDGGLGTHWMLPRTIKMKAPQSKDAQTAPEKIELDAIAARQLIENLHQSVPESEFAICYHEKDSLFGVGSEGRENLPTINEWIRKSNHQKVWQSILKANAKIKEEDAK